MILTKKSKEDFLDWKVNNKNLSTIEILDFKHLSTTFQNALIIEFFSEQEYKIETGVYNLWNYCFSKEYKQSITEAIIKANEIYNESTHTNIGLI